MKEAYASNHFHFIINKNILYFYYNIVYIFLL